MDMGPVGRASGCGDRSPNRSPGHRRSGPSVAAVELATVAVEPLRAERVVESIGCTPRVAEQHHGAYPLLSEPAGDRHEQLSTEALTLHALAQVDLV
jgi:hypothetical protein